MSTTGKKIRLVVVEDHGVVLEGLKALLSAEPDLEVVGDAQTADAAVERVNELSPDLVVMDVSLRDSSGIDALKRISAARPGTHLVVLTMHDDGRTVDQAMRAGARGYVLKGSNVRELCEAIRLVARGHAYVSPHVSHYLVRGYLAQTGDDPLTEREREVLDLIAEGLTGREIADKLGVAYKTVENHRAHIMDKLGIHTTAGLVRYSLSKTK